VSARHVKVRQAPVHAHPVRPARPNRAGKSKRPKLPGPYDAGPPSGKKSN
jgi:hypothetical protein